MSDRSRELARVTRRTVVEAAIRAQTCHVGSSLSIVDILAVLYGDVMDDRDRFLLSKGHAASALYGVLGGVGVLDTAAVIDGYCADGGTLHGHPERGVPGVEMTGGSLGHGPAIAVGLALAQRAAGAGRVFCLVGDGELNEGSVWEAVALAAQLRLRHLTVIVDANGLQGLGPCAEIVDDSALVARFAAAGFAVADVNGHDHDALARALGSGRPDGRRGDGRPLAVIARTIKGYGIPEFEGEVMSHYRPLPAAQRSRLLAGLERL